MERKSERDRKKVIESRRKDKETLISSKIKKIVDREGRQRTRERENNKKRDRERDDNGKKKIDAITITCRISDLPSAASLLCSLVEFFSTI